MCGSIFRIKRLSFVKDSSHLTKGQFQVSCFLYIFVFVCVCVCDLWGPVVCSLCRAECFQVKLHHFFSQVHRQKTTAELRNGDLEDRRHKEEEKGFPFFFAAPRSDPNNNMHLR